MDKLASLRANFAARFNARPRVYRAPARVNLIGEHTDYNEGFVMPAALGLSCWVAASAREDRRLVIHSEYFGERIEINLDGAELTPSHRWTDYPAGVVSILQQSGFLLRGANLFISSEIPLGAGLSSSAALEVSVAYALLDLSGHAIDRIRLAAICQRAENEFVGARCGIMDQFISLNGRAGHALLLDCRSLEFQILPVPAGMRLVICNTKVKHEHSASQYNSRRAECEEGVALLSPVIPGIRSLRDVNLAQLEGHRNLLPPAIYRRCRHVITENDRVLQAAAALRAGDVRQFGRCMAESHRSLREDYEVSCPELDRMVEIANQQKGIYGARMTGGGFGGCTINLVDAADTAEFESQIANGYFSATGIHPEIYVCEPSGGAEAVSQGDCLAR